MPAPRHHLSLQARLSELEEKLSDDRRYLDLCLEIRTKAGATILRVGGRWDRLHECYDGEAATCTVVIAKESQIPVVLEFRAWLEAFVNKQPRKRMMLTGGSRRGGKSYIMVALVVAMAIAVPDALGWLVSPNLTKRDELERYLREIVPPEWRHYRGAPEYRFTLPNYSSVQSITGDTAEALKRGEATIIGYNEPQTCTVDIVTYGLPALIDEGGLAFFAGNPARTKRGMWFNNLRKAIIEGVINSGTFFDVSAEENDSIDQGARRDINETLYLLDEEAAKRDAAGEWIDVGDFAYPEFDGRRNVGLVPELGTDITPQLTKRRAYRAFPWFAGADFQAWPYNAGVVVKAYGDMARPTYYVVGEILATGLEDNFLDEVFFDGRFAPENLLWIGDASGTWQDAQHTKGRCSFDIFKQRRYMILPPQLRKSDRAEHPRNPDVDDRLNLVNNLLKTGRLVIDRARCPKLIEGLKECELGPTGKPRGYWSHITDALGYALWWAEPKPKQFSQPPARGDIKEIDLAIKGPRIL